MDLPVLLIDKKKVKKIQKLHAFFLPNSYTVLRIRIRDPVPF
jgi:hypothetical protein